MNLVAKVTKVKYLYFGAMVNSFVCFLFSGLLCHFNSPYWGWFICFGFVVYCVPFAWIAADKA
jgi:hypothetical protein